MTTPLYPDLPTSLPSFAAIRDNLFRDEAEAVNALLPQARLGDAAEKAVHVRALSLAQGVRQAAGKNHFEAFLQSYGLGTEEGLALMALAEALLRIPDTDCQDRLIRDLLENKDWRRSQAATWLVSAASRALLFTDGWIEASEGRHWFDRLLRKMGEPVLRTAMKAGMKVMANNFVVGETIEQALDNADKRWRYSYDMLGEAALTNSDAEAYFAAYHEAIAALGRRTDNNTGFARQSISVKLSAIHPRYEFGQIDRVQSELYGRLLDLAQAAAKADLVFSIDAEESERLEISLWLYERLLREPSLKDWRGLGLVVQAYQKRAPFVLDWLADLARDTGRVLPIRLVKGAYWDSEIKRAQQNGLAGYPVYTRKAHTDIAYMACARKMIDYGAGVFYPQFASHNAQTLAWLVEATKHTDKQFEIQRLHGMGETLHALINQREGIASRVYAPVGRFHALLPYLVRRLLENGANSSFVHQLADTRVPLEAIADNPAERIARQPVTPGVIAPSEVFAPRRNSQGFAMTDTLVLDPLRRQLEALESQQFHAAPIVGGQRRSGTAQPRTSPIDSRRQLGTLVASDAAAIEAALNLADAAQDGWADRRAEDRAALLDKAADLLEARQAEFLWLLSREAGKTLPDALGELREAVDYCRFYAHEARRLMGSPIALPGVTGESNELRLTGRGPFVAIAPWNFPLAIFLGQITAALAAGNTVIAKPSRRTPLIGMRAIEALLEAGIPGDVLHYLPGESGGLSDKLLGDGRVAGVAFTGSTGAAWKINRTLAARDSSIASLIAETGGLNAMIADSSAHVEQLIIDVLMSAFNSAGQRCSALRILLVQDDIADAVIERIGQAMKELRLGDPLQLATDVGPTIDTLSQRDLQSYCDKLAQSARLIGTTPVPAGLEHGCFFAPHAFEVSLDALPTTETFGPVLHIARFKSDGLEDAVHRVNKLGFGLTMGVHTRLDSTVETVRKLAKVGNLYVNRNQIGAVVGSQPFGGEGLSGTGFKAGGPHYLLRFACERTVTINTAAVGGNVKLMAGGEAERA
ncbi:bifunctional proline dehydrogenase/L-glutamate gamma-semialdehyde dehydrogenase PutA [Chitinimonas koreensis]|uniref:bifunctional proline dehydrogenase/L-glutamate gamma-semialdehyde dehydrogenase PutA n=1 Tax=Chitinimonas koreensis TaxID=356302 RepID=UPI00041C37E0|nr:bifunctional proline dehydrogenase/L-glutamate gamma-semialdehyde dehydrogenase PutA [Chitinimonas koreensis]QNM95696.1 bifunctional proline dehydrogenase/L-glutamate gamma-semialdehyde dehydrogenase PutA [Chitinimonas koreensis]